MFAELSIPALTATTTCVTVSRSPCLPLSALCDLEGCELLLPTEPRLYPKHDAFAWRVGLLEQGGRVYLYEPTRFIRLIASPRQRLS